MPPGERCHGAEKAIFRAPQACVHGSGSLANLIRAIESQAPVVWLIYIYQIIMEIDKQ